MFKIIWSALLAWKIARESNYSLGEGCRQELQPSFWSLLRKETFPRVVPAESSLGVEGNGREWKEWKAVEGNGRECKGVEGNGRQWKEMEGSRREKRAPFTYGASLNCSLRYLSYPDFPQKTEDAAVVICPSQLHPLLAACVPKSSACPH